MTAVQPEMTADPKGIPNSAANLPRDDVDAKSITAAFNPVDRKDALTYIQLPDELWMTVLESSCTFPPDIFYGVMLNLIKNPNVTSSHLFRADIFYDSEFDRTLSYSRGGQRESSLVNHLKAEYQPLESKLPGHDLVRTIVRQLIPRNAQLDKPLVQTCHFFSRLDQDGEKNVVLYISHVKKVDEIPFYHPEVSRLAFVHTWRRACSPESKASPGIGSISISYCLFPQTTITTKLERTALRLLQTVHKHGQGQLSGYEKRVHLDQIIPQRRYQTTYARLKAKYARHMSQRWVEVTDPGKHVFEDLGIAAFLIELWRDMYEMPHGATPNGTSHKTKDKQTNKSPFPGFVDIGCGNGLVVYILVMEGYDGRGFDARERKTWRIFPDTIQQRLQKVLLVPETFRGHHDSGEMPRTWHNGMLTPGTFIISNHADELTAWTPLLAYLNQASFIALPCCSHDLSGARFRAPPSTKLPRDELVRLPQQVNSSAQDEAEDSSETTLPQVAERGSLKRTEAQKKVPSAYSTLCSYVASLAAEVGYMPEREVLRIPSTRNHCIIGRWKGGIDSSTLNYNMRHQKVTDIVERELRMSFQDAGVEWIQRVEKLAKKPSSGH